MWQVRCGRHDLTVPGAVVIFSACEGASEPACFGYTRSPAQHRGRRLHFVVLSVRSLTAEHGAHTPGGAGANPAGPTNFYAPVAQ